MGNKVTFAERTDSFYHRSPIIVRDADSQFYLAEFDSAAQFEFFVETLGVWFTDVSWEDTEKFGILRTYELTHTIKTAPRDFWTMSEIPEGAKPIKALSNGSIVTCYFVTGADTVTIYRPNSNAHAVYHPLTIEQHVAHQQIYGLY